MSVSDIETIATQTPFVTGVSGGSGDPSPITALGTYHGIRAAIKYRMGRETMEGLKVAVQGVGSVGTYLCELLAHDGVKLWVADINEDRTAHIRDTFGAEVVGLEDIYDLNVDVYAPCALGATLNDKTIPRLKAPIIAGAANNQLLNEIKHSQMLQEYGKLYVPDYVINAGGLINVCQEMKGYNEHAARKQAANIYKTCLEIFKVAEKEGIATREASDRIAEKRIESVSRVSDLRNTMTSQVWVRS